MPDQLRRPIPKITLDTTGLPESEQFTYWAAHSRGAHLSQVTPGPFFAHTDLWNLGELQVALVDIGPFVAVRDRALVNAVDADYLQLVLFLEGGMTFESDGTITELEAPAALLRDYGQPSAATSTRMRCIILYFARNFLEDAVGPVDYQGALQPASELTLLNKIAMELIQYFPVADAGSAPLYATILRDLTAGAMLFSRSGARSEQSSMLAAAKSYIAAQPLGTLSVAKVTGALDISRSALYRLFERDGGLLAYDRMRRLRAVHCAMCNPLNSSSLAELAQRYGFRDQAALSRSFRKAFGLPPGELRQNQTHAARPASNFPPEQIRLTIASID